ncbi:MAG TPA: hypothetical protein VJL80_04350 [Aeromicrobium sp.]|nr:hypothetical protein [Aeromicrobium sp.]HKY57248.1 hypothetical protein [Aeromicrobium sp.]
MLVGDSHPGARRYVDRAASAIFLRRCRYGSSVRCTHLNGVDPVRRILGAAVVVFGSLVSVASPAGAASGPWASIAAGQTHTCAINASKTLYCWGANASGQLGDGTDMVRRVPTKISTAGIWVSVAAGGAHTCAITTGKSLYCWGYRDHGQIGNGTTEPLQQFTPKRVGAAGVWATVSTGFAHTCAITTSKSLYCWGWNDFGQIGVGVAGDQLRPKRIGTAGVWAKVTTGGAHTCAVSTGKSLYCWGYNLDGGIGDGSNVNRPSPRLIGAAGAWVGVSGGGRHTCAVSTGKSLYCWGLNDSGQVGDGSTDNRTRPKRVGTAGAWAGVSAGEQHTCALSSAKTLYCWGLNASGQVGDNTFDTPKLAARKAGPSGVWSTASAGAFHTCGITTGRALYCWGDNSNGQIGIGNRVDQPYPTPVP